MIQTGIRKLLQEGLVGRESEMLEGVLESGRLRLAAARADLRLVRPHGPGFWHVTLHLLKKQKKLLCYDFPLAPSAIEELNRNTLYFGISKRT